MTADERAFEVGDIVEAFGLRGVVTDKQISRVRVQFDESDYVEYFDHDGKKYSFHKIPTLKLIKECK